MLRPLFVLSVALAVVTSIVTLVANVRHRVDGELANEDIRMLVGALALPADSDGVARYGVLARLDLPPGSYELRLALARAADGRPGSVHSFIEIPDFAHAPLSMSGLVLESTAATVTAPLSVVSGVLPLVPTALRDFRQSDQAQVLVRVYQGGAPTPRDVSLTGTVIDSAGRVAFTQVTKLAAGVFGDPRAGEGVFELPLDRLAPGPYLLTVSAAAGRDTVRRDLRFVMH